MNRTSTLGARLNLDPSGFQESLDAAGHQAQNFAGDLNQLGQHAQRDLSSLSRRFTGDLSRMAGRASSDLSKIGRSFSSQVSQMGRDMNQVAQNSGNAAQSQAGKWAELGGKAMVASTVWEIGKAGAGFVYDQAKGALDQEVMIDSVARGLASVSDGSETIAEQMKNIAEAAKMPGTGFTEIAQGSLKLQAVGVSAKDSREALVQFGNALANVGSGKAELEGITDALNGMFGEQAVTSETIDSLSGLYPAIRSMLPNVDASTPETFLKGIVAELQTLPRAAGNAKDAMDNLSDAYEAFRNKITKGKINTSVTEAVNASAAFMEAEGFGAKLSALKDGISKTVGEAIKPDTGFEKYEISAEEIAKRKRKKEEDAEKVKAKALKAAQDLMQGQVDQLEQQRAIVRAVAEGDEKRREALETQLVIMKEAKAMAEAQKITEEEAAELLKRRIDAERRLKEADPSKANARKKILEEEEVAALRAKGKDRKADKLVEQRTVRDRKEQLRDTGFTAEEADHIAEEESKRRQREQELQRGQRRIKGAKSKPVQQGIGSETHVFEKGNQGPDERIFQPTGMRWKPRLLRNPDGTPAGEMQIPPPAAPDAPETPQTPPDAKTTPAPDAAPTAAPSPAAAPASPETKPAPPAPPAQPPAPDAAPPPPAAPVPAPAPPPAAPVSALFPDAPPPAAPLPAPVSLPPPRTSVPPPARPDRNTAPDTAPPAQPSALDWKPRLLRNPDGSPVSDEAPPSPPSALDWKPRLLRKPDGSPVADSAPDEPLFRDGAIAGQPEPPAARRTIKGAGSKRPEGPAPGVGNPQLIPQTNQSDTPLADLILEAKKQTTLLQTIAGSGSVAEKTKPQASN